MMDGLPLHFIRPGWLLALPLAVLVPLAWRWLRRPSGDWSRVCDPHLLRWLSVGGGNASSGRLGAWFSGATLALASLALAGPSWERLPDTSFSARDARVLVLDLSASMLAEDLKPDRLTQVRFRLSDMLEQMQEGQIGLVAYAGDAYVVSPLTSDTRTIANMLPSLQPDIMPVGGSRADRAMRLAAELLQRAGLPRGDILLITDSADASGVDTAAELANEGIRTSVLAVGTAEGAPIPSGSGFVSDSSGAVVIVRVDEDLLRQVAAAGGGRFTLLDAARASGDPWGVGRGEAFTARDDGYSDRWRDVGPWLVLLLLPGMALAFRRGVLFSLALTFLPMLLASPPAQAGWWDDLWLTRDQQAQSALQDDRPGEAAVVAKDPRLAGEAWYRAGEFERAHRDWAQMDSATSHYNRGNALAQAGELDGALAAYDEALARDPQMEDALFNRALVEQMKKQQEQQQQQQDSEGESGDQSESQDSGEPSDQQEGEGEPESEEGESEQEGQPGEEPQELESRWSEEDAQAMEQWLRRIPDDPGGLLRRKFRSQHLQRGAPESEEETW